MRFQLAAVAFVASLVAAAPVAQQDVDSILAALAQNSPEDANTARSGLTKRTDDVESILKDLEKNSPADAEIARDGFKLKKRADDVNSILKELEKNS
jgi:hypothetical protein